jgi:large subunit ribosomal protein L13
MNTTNTSQKQIQEKWYLLDATGVRLGRLATVASQLLLAKETPAMRDYIQPLHKVVIINAANLDVTPKRAETKYYTNYSGFPGGIKYTSLKEMMAKFPERAIEKAIHGMLPKNKRGSHIFTTNLYVYSGAEHKHTAQNPVLIDAKQFKI